MPVTVPIVHLHIHPVKASLGLFPGHDQLAVLAHSPDVEDVTGGIKVHIGSFALGAVSANSVQVEANHMLPVFQVLDVQVIRISGR